MKIREKIKGYMYKGEWMHKGLIVDEVVAMSDESLLHETVGRELRRMYNDNLLYKRKVGKSLEYRLVGTTMWKLEEPKQDIPNALFDLEDSGKMPERDYSFTKK